MFMIKRFAVVLAFTLYGLAFNVQALTPSIEVTSEAILDNSPPNMSTGGSDFFADATVIPADAVSFTDTGSIVGATGEPGEPDHAYLSAPLNSHWWTWTPSTSVRTTISTSGNGTFSTSVAVYTGASVDALTEVVSSSYLSGSRVAFDPVAGTTYHIAIDGYYTSTGNYSFNMTQVVPVNDNFANALVLDSTQSAITVPGTTINASGEPGEPNHTGNSIPLTSVWWSWTPISGERTTMHVGGSFTTNLAIYTGASVDALTEVASSTFNAGAQVGFDPIPGTTYYIAVAGRYGSTGNYNLMVNQAFNNTFATGTVIPADADYFVDSGSTVGATGEPGEPNHAGNSIPLGSHWWTWTPSTSGLTRIHTYNSAYDPTLAVYTGDRVDALTEVVSNDNYIDGSCCVRNSVVKFYAVAGATYHIAVDGARAETVDYSFTLTRIIPANDNFADATVLDFSQPIITVSGTNRDAIASGEPGEPNHAGVSAPLDSVWYRFTPTASRTIGLIRASGTVGIYTGTDLASLSAVDLARPTSSGPTRVEVFNVVAGTTYYIAVDSYGNTLGDFGLALINTPVAVVDGQLVVLGGSGNDFVEISPLGNRVDGFTGVRIVSTINGEQSDAEYFGFFSSFYFALFYMGGGDDHIQFSPTLGFRTTIHLGEGNNTLISANGQDGVTAGSGNDRINTGTGADTVNAGDGDNIVDIFAGSVTTGSGNDVVRGGGGNNIIRTGDGNDYIDAGDGDDLVDAGPGNDIVYGGSGNDVLIGGDGRDELYGGDGHDLLVGGLGGDELYGGTGNDILFAQHLTGIDATLGQLRAKLNAWIIGGLVTFDTSNLIAVYDYKPKKIVERVLGEGGTDLFSGLDHKDLVDQSDDEGTIFLP
jgi:Ca2+-binding RTX toxin-like protein